MPIVDGLMKKYGKQIELKRVNILDPSSEEMMAAYGFSAAPEIYLIDRNGKISAFWDDVVSSEELSQAVEKVLQ